MKEAGWQAGLVGPSGSRASLSFRGASSSVTTNLGVHLYGALSLRKRNDPIFFNVISQSYRPLYFRHHRALGRPRSALQIERLVRPSATRVLFMRSEMARRRRRRRRRPFRGAKFAPDERRSVVGRAAAALRIWQCTARPASLSPLRSLQFSAQQSAMGF